jgi:outer membrane protein assembly factor BamE (lipoprotein component of BamABCDE complex)
MRSGTKIVRLCALLAAFMALSAMAGCPKSSDFQNGNQHTDGQPDHAGPGADGMRHTMGDGTGGMGMP